MNNATHTSYEKKTGATRNPSARRRHRVAAAALALLLGGVTLLTVGASAASASFSPLVNETYENFAGSPPDCTAYAGAYYRTDKMAQGDAQVPCNHQHQRTDVYVRLIRDYNGVVTYFPFKAYLGWTNSRGTGSHDLLTDPVRVCGNALWETQVSATVFDNGVGSKVDFPNHWQSYNPCA